MTEQADGMKMWDVMVTVDATMTATIPVLARTPEEAGDLATSRDQVVANQSKFETDIDNFYNWAGDAYLPDPDEGIQLEDPSKRGSDLAKVLYTESQLDILAQCSSAYEPDGTVDLARCVESGQDLDNPSQTTDGLARAIAVEFRDVLRGESEENTIPVLKNALAKMRDQITDIEDALDRAVG